MDSTSTAPSAAAASAATAATAAAATAVTDAFLHTVQSIQLDALKEKAVENWTRLQLLREHNVPMTTKRLVAGVVTVGSAVTGVYIIRKYQRRKIKHYNTHSNSSHHNTHNNSAHNSNSRVVSPAAAYRRSRRSSISSQASNASNSPQLTRTNSLRSNSRHGGGGGGASGSNVGGGGNNNSISSTIFHTHGITFGSSPSRLSSRRKDTTNNSGDDEKQKKSKRRKDSHDDDNSAAQSAATSALSSRASSPSASSRASPSATPRPAAASAAVPDLQTISTAVGSTPAAPSAAAPNGNKSDNNSSSDTAEDNAVVASPTAAASTTAIMPAVSSSATAPPPPPRSPTRSRGAIGGYGIGGDGVGSVIRSNSGVFPRSHFAPQNNTATGGPSPPVVAAPTTNDDGANATKLMSITTSAAADSTAVPSLATTTVSDAAASSSGGIASAAEGSTTTTTANRAEDQPPTKSARVLLPLNIPLRGEGAYKKCDGAIPKKEGLESSAATTPRQVNTATTTPLTTPRRIASALADILSKAVNKIQATDETNALYRRQCAEEAAAKVMGGAAAKAKTTDATTTAVPATTVTVADGATATTTTTADASSALRSNIIAIVSSGHQKEEGGDATNTYTTTTKTTTNTDKDDADPSPSSPVIPLMQVPALKLPVGLPPLRSDSTLVTPRATNNAAGSPTTCAAQHDPTITGTFEQSIHFLGSSTTSSAMNSSRGGARPLKTPRECEEMIARAESFLKSLSEPDVPSALEAEQKDRAADAAAERAKKEAEEAEEQWKKKRIEEAKRALVEAKYGGSLSDVTANNDSGPASDQQPPTSVLDTTAPPPEDDGEGNSPVEEGADNTDPVGNPTPTSKQPAADLDTSAGPPPTTNPYEVTPPPSPSIAPGGGRKAVGGDGEGVGGQQPNPSSAPSSVASTPSAVALAVDEDDEGDDSAETGGMVAKGGPLAADGDGNNAGKQQAATLGDAPLPSIGGTTISTSTSDHSYGGTTVPSFTISALTTANPSPTASSSGGGALSNLLSNRKRNQQQQKQQDDGGEESHGDSHPPPPASSSSATNSHNKLSSLLSSRRRANSAGSNSSSAPATTLSAPSSSLIERLKAAKKGPPTAGGAIVTAANEDEGAENRPAVANNPTNISAIADDDEAEVSAITVSSIPYSNLISTTTSGGGANNNNSNHTVVAGGCDDTDYDVVSAITPKRSAVLGGGNVVHNGSFGTFIPHQVQQHHQLLRQATDEISAISAISYNGNTNGSAIAAATGVVSGSGSGASSNGTGAHLSRDPTVSTCSGGSSRSGSAPPTPSWTPTGGPLVSDDVSPITAGGLDDTPTAATTAGGTTDDDEALSLQQRLRAWKNGRTARQRSNQDTSTVSEADGSDTAVDASKATGNSTTTTTATPLTLLLSKRRLEGGASASSSRASTPTQSAPKTPRNAVLSLLAGRIAAAGTTRTTADSAPTASSDATATTSPTQQRLLSVVRNRESRTALELMNEGRRKREERERREREARGKVDTTASATTGAMKEEGPEAFTKTNATTTTNSNGSPLGGMKSSTLKPTVATMGETVAYASAADALVANSGVGTRSSSSANDDDDRGSSASATRGRSATAPPPAGDGTTSGANDRAKGMRVSPSAATIMPNGSDFGSDEEEDLADGSTNSNRDRETVAGGLEEVPITPLEGTDATTNSSNGSLADRLKRMKMNMNQQYSKYDAVSKADDNDGATESSISALPSAVDVMAATMAPNTAADGKADITAPTSTISDRLQAAMKKKTQQSSNPTTTGGVSTATTSALSSGESTPAATSLPPLAPTTSASSAATIPNPTTVNPNNNATVVANSDNTNSEMKSAPSFATSDIFTNDDGYVATPMMTTTKDTTTAAGTTSAPLTAEALAKQDKANEEKQQQHQQKAEQQMAADETAPPTAGAKGAIDAPPAETTTAPTTAPTAADDEDGNPIPPPDSLWKALETVAEQQRHWHELLRKQRDALGAKEAAARAVIEEAFATAGFTEIAKIKGQMTASARTINFKLILKANAAAREKAEAAKAAKEAEEKQKRAKQIEALTKKLREERRRKEEAEAEARRKALIEEEKALAAQRRVEHEATLQRLAALEEDYKKQVAASLAAQQQSASLLTHLSTQMALNSLVFNQSQQRQQLLAEAEKSAMELEVVEQSDRFAIIRAFDSAMTATEQQYWEQRHTQQLTALVLSRQQEESVVRDKWATAAAESAAAMRRDYEALMQRQRQSSEVARHEEAQSRERELTAMNINLQRVLAATAEAEKARQAAKEEAAAVAATVAAQRDEAIKTAKEAEQQRKAAAEAIAKAAEEAASSSARAAAALKAEMDEQRRRQREAFEAEERLRSDRAKAEAIERAAAVAMEAERARNAAAAAESAKERAVAEEARRRQQEAAEEAEALRKRLHIAQQHAAEEARRAAAAERAIADAAAAETAAARRKADALAAAEAEKRRAVAARQQGPTDVSMGLLFPQYLPLHWGPCEAFVSDTSVCTLAVSVPKSTCSVLATPTTTNNTTSHSAESHQKRGLVTTADPNSIGAAATEGIALGAAGMALPNSSSFTPTTSTSTSATQLTTPQQTTAGGNANTIAPIPIGGGSDLPTSSPATSASSPTANVRTSTVVDMANRVVIIAKDIRPRGNGDAHTIAEDDEEAEETSQQRPTTVEAFAANLIEGILAQYTGGGIRPASSLQVTSLYEGIPPPTDMTDGGAMIFDWHVAVSFIVTTTTSTSHHQQQQQQQQTYHSVLGYFKLFNGVGYAVTMSSHGVPTGGRGGGGRSASSSSVSNKRSASAIAAAAAAVAGEASAAATNTNGDGAVSATSPTTSTPTTGGAKGLAEDSSQAHQHQHTSGASDASPAATDDDVEAANKGNNNTYTTVTVPAFTSFVCGIAIDDQFFATRTVEGAVRYHLSQRRSICMPLCWRVVKVAATATAATSGRATVGGNDATAISLAAEYDGGNHHHYDDSPLQNYRQPLPPPAADVVGKTTRFTMADDCANTLPMTVYVGGSDDGVDASVAVNPARCLTLASVEVVGRKHQSLEFTTFVPTAATEADVDNDGDDPTTSAAADHGYNGTEELPIPSELIRRVMKTARVSKSVPLPSTTTSAAAGKDLRTYVGSTVSFNLPAIRDTERYTVSSTVTEHLVGAFATSLTTTVTPTDTVAAAAAPQQYQYVITTQMAAIYGPFTSVQTSIFGNAVVAELVKRIGSPQPTVYTPPPPAAANGGAAAAVGTIAPVGTSYTWAAVGGNGGASSRAARRGAAAGHAAHQQPQQASPTADIDYHIVSATCKAEGVWSLVYWVIPADLVLAEHHRSSSSTSSTDDIGAIVTEAIGVLLSELITTAQQQQQQPPSSSSSLIGAMVANVTASCTVVGVAEGMSAGGSPSATGVPSPLTPHSTGARGVYLVGASGVPLLPSLPSALAVLNGLPSSPSMVLVSATTPTWPSFASQPQQQRQQHHHYQSASAAQRVGSTYSAPYFVSASASRSMSSAASLHNSHRRLLSSKFGTTNASPSSAYPSSRMW